jgi:hypothetical protein
MGPWFMQDKWKDQSYYGSVRYPGRVFAQSALVRSHNVTRIRNRPNRNKYHEDRRGHIHRDPSRGDGRREDRDSDESASEEQEPDMNRPNIQKKYHEDPEAKKKVDVFNGKQVKDNFIGIPGDEMVQESHVQRLHREARKQNEERKEDDQYYLPDTPDDHLPRDIQERPKKTVRRLQQEEDHSEYQETPLRRLRRENQKRKKEMVKGAHEESQQGERQVTRRRSKQELIQEWLANVNKISLDELQEGNLLKYPSRYLLNITAQKIWYDAHGTEQVIVIVVRDEAISFQSRLKSHCQVVELAKEEEGIATAILNDAIKTFFLDDKSGFQSGFDGRWTAKTVHGIIQEASIWDPGLMIENKTDPSDLLHFSLIPARNNVILVSYEAMMKYEQNFVLELYKVLGIESQFQPEFKDGNAKYRKGYKRGGDMDKNEDSRHVLKLEFDGARLLLPASMWFVVAVCFFGAGCVLGFWLLLFRYLFRLTCVYPNGVSSRRRRRERRLQMQHVTTGYHS